MQQEMLRVIITILTTNSTFRKGGAKATFGKSCAKSNRCFALLFPKVEKVEKVLFLRLQFKS